ncbi:MAG: hypothetical protein IJY02_00280 [Oscillospiraceae bacterium]|nr:hypothetical protein [Oscillospiraceae bacterium]
MEQRNQFTEEMLRQMYQRRGYQVMRLCSEAVNDRQKAMDMTFQAFGDAYRQLGGLPGELSAEEQDDILLECTRKVVRSALNIPEEPAQPIVLEDMPSPMPEAEEEIPPVLNLEDLPILEEEPSLPEPEAALPEEPAAPSMIEKFNTMQAEAPLEDNSLELTDTSGSTFGWSLLVFILVLVILALLWAIWGVAQNIFPIPQLDLGYQWFNANVYPLF